MTDLGLRLLTAASNAKDVRGFWEAALDLFKAWSGARWAALEYQGLNERGTVTAGPEPGLIVPEAFPWAGDDGRKAELRLAGARNDMDRAVAAVAVEGAARLAMMVGRRVGLERERRLGTFLVELSRWLMAAPETELLLRYTLQSVMALVDAGAAYVALKQGEPDTLRIVTAMGAAAPAKGSELSLHGSTTGRVIRSGEAILTENLSAEHDASGSVGGVGGAASPAPEARAAMIAPLHTSSGVIGAAGVIRSQVSGAPMPPPFTVTDLHYFTAVAAHIAGGIELSTAVATARTAADRARAMVNASPLPMSLVDQNGVVAQLNEAGCKVFGIATEAEALGHPLERLGLSPSGVTMRLVLANRQNGEPWHGRVLVTQPRGERRICDCTVTGLAGLGSDALLVALYDRTDELRAQRELIAREKLATVGEIASGVAHEVNNPLTAIRMEAELLTRGTREAETSAAAGTIIREVDRAARIVRSLLRLARRADTTPTRVHLNELVRDVAEIRQRVLRTEGVEIRTEMDQATPPVLALGQELQQVVINLVTNAEHAVRNREPAIIRLSTKAHGGWVRLTVEDSGPGVPKEVRARIFDPFFTTKGPDEGSGLGLAICQRVVAEVGGRIWLEDSEELGGAKFVAELPAAPEDLRSASAVG